MNLVRCEKGHFYDKDKKQFLRPLLLLSPSSPSPLRGLPLLSHPALPLRYRQQRRRPDRQLPQTA